MYKNWSIAVVVPAYNEETQILKVLTTVPDFVDLVIIINDCSTDKTKEVVCSYLDQHSAAKQKMVLLNHEENQGVGGSIASGYKWARDHNYDIAVVMAGDGQMDPLDLPKLLDPIIEKGVDYTKANRLISGEAYKLIPPVRYFGNAALSFLTKIASGYWHIADSQTGYTAINKKALKLIDWDKMYKRYGQPNDLLVRLNVCNLRVCDVEIRPVYNIGEKSNLNPLKAVFTIGWLIFKLWLWRMKEKYIIRDFHPLIFFYFLGCSLLLISFPLTIRMIYYWIITNHIPQLNALTAMFACSLGFQAVFFAMWLDMDYNKNLR